MEMPQHTDEAKAHFRSLVTEGPGVEVKPMFGSLGAFVNGNMYAGLFGADVGVKPGDVALAELDRLPGTGPFGPEDRPMRGWRSLPADLPDADKTAWLERAREHVGTLPPKQPKAPRGRRA
jgi:hypothetical protein